MSATFHVVYFDWNVSNGWLEKPVVLPLESGVVEYFGSGKNSIKYFSDRWKNSDVGRTSRSVFSAFCDSLRSKEDHLSGGAPQLVGLYREGAAQTFGIVYRNERYLLGMPVENSQGLNNVEWRNELFERCDANTMERIVGAQRHSRPPSVKREAG